MSRNKFKKKGKLSLFLNKRISKPRFIYYNFLCKNIVRDKGCFIIPHRKAILDLHPTSRIYLHGKDLEVGFNQLHGSNSETHIRLDKDAVWNCNNGGLLFYNTVVEIKPGAVFDSGFFSANGGSVIIADKHIVFGEDVMIGRNVIVYDSDFHQLCDVKGEPSNPPQTVVIGDHVWLTNNIMVLKGVTIGRDSVVAAQTVVNKDMPEHSIIAGKSSGTVIKDTVHWDRKRCIRN